MSTNCKKTCQNTKYNVNHKNRIKQVILAKNKSKKGNLLEKKGYF